MYPELNLSQWPFHVTPDRDFASVWAGRPNTRRQLERLTREMRLFPNSSLHILWANFGMGKTHALYHLRYLLEKNKDAPYIIPIYAVMPRRSTGFLELYREIVQGLPYEFLRKQIQKLGNSYKGSISLHPMFQQSPGVVKALLAMNDEDIEATTNARQWLAAQQGLSKSQMDQIGVTYRIKTPEDALNALSALTNLVCYDPNPEKTNRLVIMVDEYQRVGERNPKIAAENNSGLHSYFNAHPNGLHLILTFSFGNKKNVDFLLSDELKSRARPQNISLDILTENEAIEFIGDLFRQFRCEPDDRTSYPFSMEAVKNIINVIASNKTLTPRRLMHYFNFALQQCVIDELEPGEQGYTVAQIATYLAGSRLGDLDKDEADD